MSPKNKTQSRTARDVVARGAKAGRLMSQANAAKYLGMHRATVLARVLAGEIEADTLDGRVVLVRASVEAYRQRLLTERATAASAA